MADTHDIETVVVGAGVVGLAVARELVAAGQQVWVLERAERAGEGISSRNSGVIHAGFPYPHDSLRARLCLRGRNLLYEFCTRRGVPHRRCGKLVVATRQDDIAALQALAALGALNGVGGLTLLDGGQARAAEPALRCVAALESPDSGIVDVAELVMALAGEVEQGESRLLAGVDVVSLQAVADGFVLRSARGEAVRCRRVVNAAGLGAVALASKCEGLDPSHLPRLHYGAGHYYALRGRAPFSRLVYPVPGRHSLGVHLGFDLGGRARFGPDLRWIERPDYRFDDSRRGEFVEGVRSWWPGLDPDDLSPDFVGVRPKLSGPGEPAADFVLQDETAHGVRGLVNLFGIDSPGLTSSLAIGEDVRRRLLALD